MDCFWAACWLWDCLALLVVRWREIKTSKLKSTDSQRQCCPWASKCWGLLLILAKQIAWVNNCRLWVLSTFFAIKHLFSFVVVCSNHIFVPFFWHVYSIFTALPPFFFAVIFVILLSFTIRCLIFAIMSFVTLMLQSFHMYFYKSIRG